jgi:ribosomal-protein-alanine N-acetyltransferase
LDEQSHWGFLVCHRDTGAIAGVIDISNAVRGSFQSAYLGYYAFAGCDRQGLMREGLQAVLRYAFRTLKLHRLEANIQPGNIASITLVRTCGFKKEGFSPRYLKVYGRWRDHERWAILAP